MPQEKIVGILGGMGPEATVDLMHRIIKNTPAADDIDHIRCIIDNNPKVPSRIKALIEGTGENPGPAMADMGRRLESWGADFLVIACNTAHNYYSDVQKAVNIPVLNMIALTVDATLAAMPGVRKVGVLASPAVRTTRLYTDLLVARGIEVIYPSPEKETELLEVIKAVKTGDTGRAVKDKLAAVVRNEQEQGAELCIVACTELGVILEDYAVPTVDAAEVIARAVVATAKGGPGTPR